jgi:hypothetical protein
MARRPPRARAIWMTRRSRAFGCLLALSSVMAVTGCSAWAPTEFALRDRASKAPVVGAEVQVLPERIPSIRSEAGRTDGEGRVVLRAPRSSGVTVLVRTDSVHPYSLSVLGGVAEEWTAMGKRTDGSPELEIRSSPVRKPPSH